LAPPSLTTTLDTPHTGSMDDAVRDYVEAIDPRHRPLFDRLHRLVLEAHPDAAVVLSYQIPTYRVGRNRLFLGVWKHGVSVYGFQQGRDGGFIARHPELKTSTGRSGCGRRTPPASPTRSFASWSAPPWTAERMGLLTVGLAGWRRPWLRGLLFTASWAIPAGCSNAR
jgi:hypothetical protein